MADNFAAPVPSAVKATAANAAKLQEEFIKSQGEGNPAEPQEPEESQEEPVEPQEPEEPQEEPAVEEPQLPLSEDAKSWKHKFESMQGRFKGASDQIKALRDEVGNLNRLLASLERPESAAPAEPPKSLLTPQEIDEYGPEFVDMISRITKQATAPYEQEINNLKEQLKRVGGRIDVGARQQMMSRLESEVPEWEAINVSEEFVQWLALPDPYSGDIRHNMLKRAFERNDSPRVINFFKGFLAETAATAPAGEEPGQRTPKTPLRNLAAPGRAKSTAAPNKAPVEKPTFTASQIAKFYTDKGLGKWRGREKEAQQIEADIFMAQSEGRLR